MGKLNDRLMAACEKDPSIVVSKDKITEAKGNTEDYLLSLGLTKGDLLKLERGGLAVRAYTQNWYYTGDTLPNGKVVTGKREIPYKKRIEMARTNGYTRYGVEEITVALPVFTGHGRRKLWLLIAP